MSLLHGKSLWIKLIFNYFFYLFSDDLLQSVQSVRTCLLDLRPVCRGNAAIPMLNGMSFNVTVNV